MRKSTLENRVTRLEKKLLYTEKFSDNYVRNVINNYIYEIMIEDVDSSKSLHRRYPNLASDFRDNKFEAFNAYRDICSYLVEYWDVDSEFISDYRVQIARRIFEIAKDHYNYDNEIMRNIVPEDIFNY